MKKQVLFILLILFIIIISCEEIYKPDLKVEGNFLVVEAILYADNQYNYIYLYKSREFGNNNASFERISGANIFLTDDNGTKIQAAENGTGNYRLEYQLEENRTYYLTIETGGETYISETQSIREVPKIDTVYGAYEDNVYTTGAASSTDDIITKHGIRLFADISYQGSLNYYRFDGRKILQYQDHYDTVIGGVTYELPIYGWRSYYPTGSFNIAGPPEYSTEKNITKHHLEFFIENYYELIADTQYFKGWIYIIEQYGLNRNTFDYYKSLNSQLESEGKIFDPVYVQAEGNISCPSNPESIVLGNFEISSHNEYRYFLRYNRNHEEFDLKPIPYFYDIPENGYIKDIMPDFWEALNKKYPDE